MEEAVTDRETRSYGVVYHPKRKESLLWLLKRAETNKKSRSNTNNAITAAVKRSLRRILNKLQKNLKKIRKQNHLSCKLFGKWRTRQSNLLQMIQLNYVINELTCKSVIVGILLSNNVNIRLLLDNNEQSSLLTKLTGFTSLL